MADLAFDAVTIGGSNEGLRPASYDELSST
jgi:hypothetical protein